MIMSENAATEVHPVNGGSPTSRKPTPKPAARKRPSSASRKAAATRGKQQPAKGNGTQREQPAAKGNGKSAGNGKVSAKVETAELKPNEVKRIVGDALIDAAAELARTWADTRVPKAQAAELLGSYVSFTPGGYWRRELPEPQTGRGARHRLAK
jgi:hypothetical protein